MAHLQENFRSQLMIAACENLARAHVKERDINFKGGRIPSIVSHWVKCAYWLWVKIPAL